MSAAAKRENLLREVRHVAGELEGWRRDAVLAALDELEKAQQRDALDYTADEALADLRERLGYAEAEVVRLRGELETLKEAARSLHAGLTCEQDPMDVDERIERLGRALAAVSEPKESGQNLQHES